MTKMKGLEAIPGTIYGEIKLSEHLGQETEKLKGEIQELRKQLREAEQSYFSASSEVNFYKNKCLDLESHLKLLRMHRAVAGKEFDDRDMTVTKLKVGIRTLQESYNRMEEDYKKGNSLLQEQYAIIDKLRNKETSQDHTTSLLQMENDIIGERLKGLYFAIEHAVDHKILEENLSIEVRQNALALGALSKYIEGLIKRVDEVVVQRDTLVNDLAEATTNRQEMKAERDRIAKLAKEKIAVLQVQLQKSEEGREKLGTELSKTEQNFKDLTDEYEKLRQKAKQYKLRRKQYGEEEEKVCKNCQRVFVESENYNWSCRRHQSEYSGEIYWCCGKSGKETPGCKTSKHESKEEEEESQEVGKDNSDPSSVRCSVLLT